jgi:hypothetical protein
MAPTIEQLESMSDDELRAAYNDVARNTVIGLEWYREEMRRRGTERQTRALIRLTWAIVVFTVILVVFDVLAIVIE